jgi:hypothetical protein
MLKRSPQSAPLLISAARDSKMDKKRQEGKKQKRRYEKMHLSERKYIERAEPSLRTIGPCLNVERIIEKFVIKYNGARRADNNPCHLIITETVSVAVNRASAQGLLIFTTCPKRD